VVFRLLFSFCDLVFTFSLCSVFAKKNLEWYFVFRFYKIWYFDFPLFFAIWYFCFVSAIVLVFHLLFSFCNLVFAFSFCKKKNLEWYFVFRFCKILYFDFSSASAMVSTTKEIIWLWWLLADMRVFFSHPTPMYCDNQSSIQIAHNSVFQANEAHWDRLSSYLSIISSMTPLLCLLFLLPCRFLYQDVFHLLFSFSSWQTLDACSCRIMSLRGDVK